MQTYQGDGWTISYPQGWKATKNGVQVQFTDATNTAVFVVQTTPNPNGAGKPETGVAGGLAAFKASAKNYKEDPTTTATVGGTTWQQGSASADVEQSGQTANVKTVILATNHPEKDPTTKLYALIYAAPTLLFDASNQSYFQPMLQSFKFTS
jgi:hypothetical protein